MSATTRHTRSTTKAAKAKGLAPAPAPAPTEVKMAAALLEDNTEVPSASPDDPNDSAPSLVDSKPIVDALREKIAKLEQENAACVSFIHEKGKEILNHEERHKKATADAQKANTTHTARLEKLNAQLNAQAENAKLNAQKAQKAQKELHAEVERLKLSRSKWLRVSKEQLDEATRKAQEQESTHKAELDALKQSSERSARIHEAHMKKLQGEAGIKEMLDGRNIAALKQHNQVLLGELEAARSPQGGQPSKKRARHIQITQGSPAKKQCLLSKRFITARNRALQAAFEALKAASRPIEVHKNTAVALKDDDAPKAPAEDVE